MRILLIVMSVLELGAGVALLCVPSWTVSLLLGSTLDSRATLALGRLAGAALLTLSIACWLVRDDATGRGRRAVVSAMVVYNLGAVIVLGAAGLQMQPARAILWFAVLLHAAIAAWCTTCLFRRTIPVAA
jgi:hypothetical protein